MPQQKRSSQTEPVYLFPNFNRSLSTPSLTQRGAQTRPGSKQPHNRYFLGLEKLVLSKLICLLKNPQPVWLHLLAFLCAVELKLFASGPFSASLASPCFVRRAPCFLCLWPCGTTLPPNKKQSLNMRSHQSKTTGLFNQVPLLASSCSRPLAHWLLQWQRCLRHP